MKDEKWGKCTPRNAMLLYKQADCPRLAHYLPSPAAPFWGWRQNHIFSHRHTFLLHSYFKNIDIYCFWYWTTRVLFENSKYEWAQKLQIFFRKIGKRWKNTVLNLKFCVALANRDKNTNSIVFHWILPPVQCRKSRRYSAAAGFLLGFIAQFWRNQWFYRTALYAVRILWNKTCPFYFFLAEIESEVPKWSKKTKDFCFPFDEE